MKTGTEDRCHLEENSIAVHENVHEEFAYDLEHVVDSILDRLRRDTDAALAEALHVEPSFIKDIRRMRRPVDAAMRIWIYELRISTLGVCETFWATGAENCDLPRMNRNVPKIRSFGSCDVGQRADTIAWNRRIPLNRRQIFHH